MTGITNVLIAGLGGQGVLTASDLLAFSAFEYGFDVKKSEIKGMSSAEVRYQRVVRKKVESLIPPAGRLFNLLNQRRMNLIYICSKKRCLNNTMENRHYNCRKADNKFGIGLGH
jgi:hypothetical protein